MFTKQLQEGEREWAQHTGRHNSCISGCTNCDGRNSYMMVVMSIYLELAHPFL